MIIWVSDKELSHYTFHNKFCSDWFSFTKLGSPAEAGHQKISLNSYCSSPRKSLVKGERFIRSEEKHECTAPLMLQWRKSSPNTHSSVMVQSVDATSAYVTRMDVKHFIMRKTYISLFLFIFFLVLLIWVTLHIQYINRTELTLNNFRHFCQ